MESKKPLQIGRAFFHFITIMFAWGVGTWCPYSIAQALGMTFVVIIVGIEELRLKNKKFGKYIHHVFDGWFREEEKTKRSTMIYAITAMVIIHGIFPLEVFQVSMLVLAIADPLARLVGMSIGGETSLPGAPRKTLLGSCAFLVTTIIIMYFYGLWWQALIVACVATIAEAYSSRRWLIDDNFTVPIFTALTMYVCT